MPHKIKDIGRGPFRYTWISICSKHQQPIYGCRLCDCGDYRNVWKMYLDSQLFNYCPKLWRYLRNRKLKKIYKLYC